MTAENPEDWRQQDDEPNPNVDIDGIRTPEEARIRKLEERQRDMVHKADVREMIEEWREFAAGCGGGA